MKASLTITVLCLLTCAGCADVEPPPLPPAPEPPADSARPPLEPITHEHLASLWEEIARIEAACKPKRGTPRAEIEAKFGEGRPLHWASSKLPQTEPPPTDSRRRGYDLCANGTLAVRYDSEWKVRQAGFRSPPGSTHGMLPYSPDRDEGLRFHILNAVLRLEQMKRVLAAYEAL